MRAAPAGAGRHRGSDRAARGRARRALAASAPSDATHVVFHTAVLMYLDDAGREAFVRQVGELPGHWLSVEGRSVVPGIRVRDDVPNDSSDLVLAVDGVQRAWAHPHGRALTWAPNP
ncbi:DUF2332 family protein [Agromyces laixinhei]|uniref:DUF2332 family protein n=1 Tax=Agromyces laixinhei TaxID=2585717 RepID=UPI0018DD5CFD|nr:DUF2332 family protein [Agromyces laixinhei]